jgi:hypothetical protein
MKVNSRNYIYNNGREISRQTISDYKRLFKRYGDTKTSLVLSKKAEQAIADSELFNIFEVAVDVGDDYNNIYVLSYILVFDGYQMGTFPAEKLNSMLESWWDDEF